jgi:spore coat protein U-like protein
LTTQMPVSVNVTNACTVGATPLAFGAPTSIGGTDIDATSTISLVCTNGATYTVGLDAGTNVNGSQRRMSNGAATPVYVPYGIFKDAAYTTNWGNTGTAAQSGTAGTSGLVSLTAYGRIPSSAASVAAGTYTDTVTVTVTF